MKVLKSVTVMLILVFILTATLAWSGNHGKGDGTGHCKYNSSSVDKQGSGFIDSDGDGICDNHTGSKKACGKARNEKNKTGSCPYMSADKTTSGKITCPALKPEQKKE